MIRVVETTDAYIGETRLIGLRCPELGTSIISVNYSRLVKIIPGTLQRLDRTIASCIAEVRLSNYSDALIIQIEMATLQQYDILIGNDLLCD
jgi:hypothetical protein